MGDSVPLQRPGHGFLPLHWAPQFLCRLASEADRRGPDGTPRSHLAVLNEQLHQRLPIREGSSQGGASPSHISSSAQPPPPQLPMQSPSLVVYEHHRPRLWLRRQELGDGSIVMAQLGPKECQSAVISEYLINAARGCPILAQVITPTVDYSSALSSSALIGAGGMPPPEYAGPMSHSRFLDAAGLAAFFRNPPETCLLTEFIEPDASHCNDVLIVSGSPHLASIERRLSKWSVWAGTAPSSADASIAFEASCPDDVRERTMAAVRRFLQLVECAERKRVVRYRFMVKECRRVTWLIAAERLEVADPPPHEQIQQIGFAAPTAGGAALLNSSEGVSPPSDRRSPLTLRDRSPSNGSNDTFSRSAEGAFGDSSFALAATIRSLLASTASTGVEDDAAGAAATTSGNRKLIVARRRLHSAMAYKDVESERHEAIRQKWKDDRRIKQETIDAKRRAVQPFSFANRASLKAAAAQAEGKEAAERLLTDMFAPNIVVSLGRGGGVSHKTLHAAIISGGVAPTAESILREMNERLALRSRAHLSKLPSPRRRPESALHRSEQQRPGGSIPMSPAPALSSDSAQRGSGSRRPASAGRMKRSVIVPSAAGRDPTALAAAVLRRAASAGTDALVYPEGFDEFITAPVGS